MTTLPEEAVKAADVIQVITDLRLAILQDDDEGLAEHAEPMIKAKELIAKLSASPFLPVQGAVTALKWHQEDNGDFIAESVVGWYHIGLPHRTWNLTKPTGEVLSFWTLDETKAAAQADFEARILSAIEPSAARELALEEHLHAIEQQLAVNLGYFHDEKRFLLETLQAHITTRIAAIRVLSSPEHADAGKVEGDGWLPIGSAPRDRTSVIIAVPAKEKKGGFIVGEAYFDPENYEGGDWWWAGSSHTDHFDSPISELNYNAPTHWRPLPSAPSEGAE